jgi:4'-phosphopantetheinyl transferase
VVIRRDEMSRPPLPAAAEVHISFARLDLEPMELARLERFLDPVERARANRLRKEGIRERFVAGRGYLRETLAAYLDQQPEDIRLCEGEWGKPCLAVGNGYGALYFNLSHAADLAVLAVAREREVGIDLERIAEDLPFREIARIFFSPLEQAALFSLSPDEQLAAFYRCWTRKEAYLKGCGKGLLQPLDSFDVSLLPGRPPALLAHRTSPDDPAAWSLIDISVPQGYFATLAFAGESPVIKLIG